GGCAASGHPLKAPLSGPRDGQKDRNPRIFPMRQMQDLSAEPRQGTGKGPAYQTRRTGRIPAIVYGGADAPENVSVDAHTLGLHVGAGGFLTPLFMLDVGGNKQRVVPRPPPRGRVTAL